MSPSRTREARSREHAIDRCTNPKHHKWARYGGRGIRVCVRWLSSLSGFVADMGQRPDGTTLDRMNNDGHYSCGKCDECVANGWPMNCRWATVAEQNANKARLPKKEKIRKKREPRLVSSSLAGICRSRGVSVSMVRSRVRHGMPLEEALSKPREPWVVTSASSNRGATAALVKELGFSTSTIRRRIAIGGALVPRAQNAEKHCWNCGAPGHNRKTCPGAQNVLPHFATRREV